MTRRVVVVGAGIMGSALAASLAESGDMAVTVREAGPAGRLVGSTDPAPEFVGLLTEDERCSVGGVTGLDRVGELEVALSAAGLDGLRRRATLAGDAGLRAEVLGPDEPATLTLELINPDGCVGGVHCPGDGTARAGQPHDELCERALRLYRDIFVTA